MQTININGSYTVSYTVIFLIVGTLCSI